MRFVRSHPARLFGAALLAAGTLSLPAAAGPAAAAAVVEPVGQRYQEPLYGDVTTVDPTPSPSVTTAAPAPGPGPGATGGSMAGTGSHGERLWLLGALAVVLAATGLVARAALRDRRIR